MVRSSRLSSNEILQRVEALEGAVFSHPTFESALAGLQDARDRGAVRAQGIHLKSRGCLLYGDSGAGKSTLIEHFVGPRKEGNEDGTPLPVVVVEVPESTTKRGLVSAILEEMGYAANSRDSANAIINDISDKVIRIGVELIILDEAHHILKGRNVGQLSEFIKSLLNRIGCPIVLSGLPLLREFHSFEQLERRLLPDISVEAYDWTTIEGRVEFMVLMQRFDDVLGFASSSGLGDEDLAMRFYVASGGNIGVVVRILSEALKRALKRNLEALDRNLLAEVYASLKPATKVHRHIDFTAKLEIDALTPQAILKRSRTVKVSPASNPFLCMPERCAELWEQRTFITPSNLDRRERGRGRGPKPIEAFR